MLPLGPTLCLLLSLIALFVTVEDAHESPPTADTASQRHIPSTSIHLPGDLSDPVPLTSGEIDPIHPVVVPLTSLPSENTKGYAELGEYDDMHTSAELNSLSENSDLSPPESSRFQGFISLREVEVEKEEDGLKGIGAGQRGPETSLGQIPQGGQEEASGWGVYHNEENEPPARERTEDQSLGFVPQPSSGPTHTSALDVAPSTQDRGIVDQFVTGQDGPQESQKTDEGGLARRPLDGGNDSRQQREEGEILKWPLFSVL